MNVLYLNSNLPDNHVSPLFLSNLRRNVNVKKHTYLPLVVQSTKVSQQISAIALFLALFAHLPSTSATLFRIAKGALLLELILVGLTPILKTLTKDTSDDTIYALSSLLLSANLLFCDYASTSVDTVRYPDSFSINAAIFASVLLASRLADNLKVFTLMSLSIEIFALFPILRRSLRAASKRNDVVMALGLGILSLCALSTVSYGATYVHAAILGFVTFVCPLWFLGVQKYKDEIRGPWDEAKPVFRS
ncbi:GPI2-domain-containing protein, partial [Rhizoclosmatium globosum]